MIINENILKENLFNFIKNSSSENNYKNAVTLFSNNKIYNQNAKLDDSVIYLTTNFSESVISEIKINTETGTIEINCNKHNSELCEHNIASILYFISNFNFFYQKTITPFDLIVDKTFSKEFKGIIISEKYFQHSLILHKKNNSFYLKKYLDNEEINPLKVEEFITYEQFLSFPKYFILKGKRSLTPVKLLKETQKVILIISKLNNFYTQVDFVYENNENIFHILDGALKKIFIYNDGTAKILPPQIDFNLLEQHNKSLIIDRETLNNIIYNEKYLLNNNFLIEKNNISGFKIVDTIPIIDIFLDLIDDSISVSINLKYNEKTFNIFENERVIDNTIFFRHTKEQELVDIFKKLNANIENNSYILDKKNSLEFLIEILPEKLSNCNIYGEKNLTKYKIHRPSSTTPMKVFSYKEWFEINGELDFEGEKISLVEIVKNIKKGRNYVKLKKNHYGIIPKNFLNKIKKITDDSSFSIDKDKIKVFKLEAPSKLNLFSDFENYQKIADEIKEIKEKLNDFQSIKKYHLPKNLTKILRNYQKDGVRWLLFLRDFNLNGILADEMGLGKTIQALTLLNFEKKNRPNLVIVPTSLLYNWENEIEKFAYKFNYLILYGKKRENSYKDIEKYELILTTYNIIRIDFEKIKEIDFNYIILDESQYIKNPGSIISKYIKKLNCNHRLSLTGTPFENSLTDIWSQFDFLHPNILGPLKDFKKNYFNDIEKLKKKLSPLILRRRKHDVLEELPEKTEINYFYEMNPEQKEFYDAVKAFYFEKITSSINTQGLNKSKMLILEGLLRMRQVCCHPKLTKFKHIKYKNIKSEKFENLKKIIRNFKNKNQKTVIYSQFVEMLKIIKQFMQNEKIPFEYLDGSTKKRLDKINNFQKNVNINFFLVSTKAGGLGINLTSAENVIIYDPWWNPSVENQAIDRVHRFGQNKKVFAYRMIMKNSVEEKILKLKEKKNNIFKELFQETLSLSNLTKQEIEDIFR